MQDNEFIDKLYREMYEKMYWFAYLRLNSHHLAEEIVQDVFLLAYEKAGALQASKNPQGWLVKALSFTILHTLRTQQYMISHFTEYNENLESTQYDSYGSDYGLEERLTSEEWKLLILIYNEGYTIEDAAVKLGIEFETCRKRVFRLRKKVKKNYDDVPF